MKIFLFFYFLSVMTMPVNASETEKKIEASEVNIHNYERFVAQLEYNLPIGTSADDVTQHLDKSGIEYSDVPNEGCIYIMIKKIHRSFLVVNTDLWIRIYFSDGDLSEIKSELINTAF
jgi:hypothetical protein